MRQRDTSKVDAAKEERSLWEFRAEVGTSLVRTLSVSDGFTLFVEAIKKYESAIDDALAIAAKIKAARDAGGVRWERRHRRRNWSAGRNGSAGACRDRRQGQSKRHALLGRHRAHSAGRGSGAGARGSREGGRRVLPEGRPGTQVIVLHLAASRDELAWFHPRIGEMRSIYADSRVLTARLRLFANSVIINMPIPLT